MTSFASNPPFVTADRRRAMAVLSALVLTIIALHYVARFGLQGPELLGNGGLGEWMDDPVNVIATVARWLSLFLAYYLTVIVGAVSIFGQEWQDGHWSRFAPSSITGLVALLLGISAVAVPTVTRTTSSPPQQLILQQVETDHTGALTLTEVEAPQIYAPIEQQSSELANDENETWTVTRGESFWSIAAEHLKDELSRADLTDEAVAEYWQNLIDANADRLIDPGNPDLIFPGQELLLPQVPELGD